MTVGELRKHLAYFEDEEQISCAIRHLSKDGSCKQLISCDIGDVVDEIIESDDADPHIVVDFLLPE